MVLCLAFSTDGAYVISGGNDATIRIWGTEIGNQAAVIRGHRDGVQAVAMLPDQKTIVAGDRGGQLRLWRSQGNRVVDEYELEAVSDYFASVRMSPTGRHWAGLTTDGRLLVRDITLKRVHAIRTGIPMLFGNSDFVGWRRDMLAFSPDGSRLYCADEILAIDDTHSLGWRHHVSIDENSALPSHFSPDGKAIATARQEEVKVWNAQTGQLLRKFKTPCNELVGLRFSPNNRHLATWGTQNAAICLWDWQQGTLERSYDYKQKHVMKLEFDPTGDRFATSTSDDGVRIWNVDTGVSQPLDLHIGERAMTMCWVHDGAALAVGRDGQSDVVYWVSSDRLPQQLEPAKDVQDLNTGLPSQLLTLWKRTVRVRDLEQLQYSSDPDDILQAHDDRIHCIALSPPGDQILSASRDGTLRRWTLSENSWQWMGRDRYREKHVEDFAWLWDLQSGDLRLKFSGHPASISSVAFSPDGRILAAGCEDGTIKLHHLETAQELFTIGKLDSSVHKLSFDPSGMSLLALSESGSITVFGDPRDYLEPGNVVPVLND